MIRFLLRNNFGRLLSHLVISAYELYTDFIPDVLLVWQSGGTVDWSAIVSHPVFILTIVGNAGFAIVAHSTQDRIDSEPIWYKPEQVGYYVDETTQISLEYLRNGDYKMAKKVIALQERHVKKARRR